MKGKSQLSSNSIMILIGVALLLVAITIFWQSVSSSSKEKFESAPLKVMLFHATWCSHCVGYIGSGDWDKVKKAVNEKYPSVTFETNDFDKYDKKKAANYNITSFPTIIAEDSDGKVFRFYGDRSKSGDVIKFVEHAVDGKDLSRSQYQNAAA